MNRKKLLNFHSTFAYTYYIKIETKGENVNVSEIFKKLKNYLHGHDRNSHLKSVKEFDEKSHVSRYHILYFTNKELNYSKVQKKVTPNAFVHIQLILKPQEDIENIIKLMKEIKKNNKSNLNNSTLQHFQKVTLFDFHAN